MYLQSYCTLFSHKHISKQEVMRVVDMVRYEKRQPGYQDFRLTCHPSRSGSLRRKRWWMPDPYCSGWISTRLWLQVWHCRMRYRDNRCSEVLPTATQRPSWNLQTALQLQDGYCNMNIALIGCGRISKNHFEIRDLFFLKLISLFYQLPIIVIIIYSMWFSRIQSFNILYCLLFCY